MSAEQLNRDTQRARRRAERRMALAHPAEFAALLHEEKHRAGLGHIHDPKNPETIGWWGEAQQTANEGSHPA